MDHHLTIRDADDYTGDPRAGDPEWIYLDVGSDAVEVAGPPVPADVVDIEMARESQELVPAGGDGVLAVLAVANALEYRILDDPSGGPPFTLIPLESRVCLVGDSLTSSFAFVGGDTPGVRHSLVIEAQVGGEAVGRTDALTIELGQPSCSFSIPDPLADWIEPREAIDIWTDPGRAIPDAGDPIEGPAALDLMGLDRAEGGPWIVTFAGDAESALGELGSVEVHLVFAKPDAHIVDLVGRFGRSNLAGTREVTATSPEDAGVAPDLGFTWAGDRVAVTFSEFPFPPGGAVFALVIVEVPGAHPAVMDTTVPAPCGAG